MNNHRHTPVSIAAAILAIAATYTYFLLFAEFALLRLAEPFVASGTPLRLIMGLLGAGGIAGSILAALAFHPSRLRPALFAGFVASAAAAILALAAPAAPTFLVAAFSVGAGMGWLTVTLATGLRSMLGDARLGWWCALGTGIAYAFCNIPPVFAATPRTQAVIGSITAVLGAVATLRIQSAPASACAAPDLSAPVRRLLLVVLLALVWLDSAAFYVIQHTAVLKESTWTGDPLLIGNAVTHLAAALLAGLALDRGWTGPALGLAAALLAAACAVLGHGATATSAPLLYTAGVSIYSTALVFLPARTGSPSYTALVYGLAGWGGSALGIGMAQDLQHIPVAFVAGAAAVVFTGLLMRRNLMQRAAGILGATVLLIALCPMPQARAASDDDPQIELGRKVYIAEGCIHCHSQYVRSRVENDRLWWGPARPLPEQMKETPPLFGNRRQGPDLATVGNRRSPEWQRIHLIAPRVLLPGSRMPSYAHLFTGDSSRGDALVAYLSSLGRATVPERLAANARWQPSAESLASPDIAHGTELFDRLCAACHGPKGRADGPLAPSLMLRPPDFSRDPWRRFDAANPATVAALARVVKFGLPGSAMAGHEYLSDSDAVGLAAYVQTLHKGSSPKP